MKKLCLTLSLSALALACCQSALATEKPRSLSTDKRIKVVNYQANNVVPIHGVTFTSTQIVFSKAEQIVDLQNGDSAAWTIKISSILRNILNIKPTILGSKSNLTVVTEDREGKRKNYYFELESNTKPETNLSKLTYAVEFKYPDEERAKTLAKLSFERQQKKAIVNASRNPEDYNWDYSFNGSRSIMPMHVFDDGRFTYLQLRPDQDVPAIFSVKNASGRESVVNYRREGNYIVILQTAPQFTLRAGKNAVASIFNTNAIKKIHASMFGA